MSIGSIGNRIVFTHKIRQFVNRYNKATHKGLRQGGELYTQYHSLNGGDMKFSKNPFKAIIYFIETFKSFKR